MYILDDLDDLENRKHNFDDTVDLETIQFDLSLSAKKRLEKYINKIRNPYHYKVGNVSVIINYSGSKPLDNVIAEYFIRKKE